jgi:hypothetical protein
MPGPVVQLGAVMLCPHGGQVSTITADTRVTVSGAPAATVTDTFPIAGCAFMAGPKPQPCVTARWLVAATRVFVMGNPVVIQAATGLCFSAEQIPQGPPTVASAQPRVLAT